MAEPLIVNDGNTRLTVDIDPSGRRRAVVQGLDYSIANTEWRCSMSTEVTPESLRLHAKWLRDAEGWSSQAQKMDAVADDLEREQRPLPTVPGWYPNIVVERGGKSCTGALLTEDGVWVTAPPVDYSNYHDPDDRDVTIRWAEQDGTTPGQTLWAARWSDGPSFDSAAAGLRELYERIANAVLAAHGTPTLTDAERAEAYCRGWATCARSLPDLTPVGEHPEPGTRGLLPVRVDDANEWNYEDDFTYVCDVNSKMGGTVLADPRPDGAL